MNRNDLVRILVEKISVKGCWSDFNTHRKIYNNLYRISNIPNSLLKEEELPEEPDVSDYQDNEC